MKFRVNPATQEDMRRGLPTRGVLSFGPVIKGLLGIIDRNVPRPALQDARGAGAQYKMILHCREAPACLSRPNGVAGELQSIQKLPLY